DFLTLKSGKSHIIMGKSSHKRVPPCENVDQRHRQQNEKDHSDFSVALCDKGQYRARQDIRGIKYGKIKSPTSKRQETVAQGNMQKRVYGQDNDCCKPACLNTEKLVMVFPVCR